VYFVLSVDLCEWCPPDKATSESGYFMIVVNAAMCAPWVAWIGANAVVHYVWVGTLLGCQIYQVGSRNDFWFVFLLCFITPSALRHCWLDDTDGIWLVLARSLLRQSPEVLPCSPLRFWPNLE